MKNPYEKLNYETLLHIWQTTPKGHEHLLLIRTTMNMVRRKEGRLIIGSCHGDNRHERRKQSSKKHINKMLRAKARAKKYKGLWQNAVDKS